MRIFGSDRMDGMLQKLGLQEDEAIIHPWINKAIEKAQQKVEARNFDIRKNILKYDNVMNDQRKVVFEQRRDFMAQESVRETIDEMRHGVIDDVVTRHIPPDAYPEQWDVEGLKEAVANFLNLDLPVDDWAKEEGIADEEMRERLRKAADEAYASAVETNSPEVMTYVEKQVLLQTLDHLWREHLVTLDHLRQVIGWRGYAQRDPLNEYKSEAFELFNELVGHLRQQVTGQLMRIEVVFQPPEPEGLPPMFAQHLDPATGENELALRQAQRQLRRRRPGARLCGGGARPATPRCSSATRTTRRAGARSAATRPAPAAPARSTSTATGGSGSRSHALSGRGLRIDYVNGQEAHDPGLGRVLRRSPAAGREARHRALPRGNCPATRDQTQPRRPRVGRLAGRTIPAKGSRGGRGPGIRGRNAFLDGNRGGRGSP